MKISTEFVISIILILLFTSIPFIYNAYLLVESYIERIVKYYKIKKWRNRHKKLINDRDYIYSNFKIKSIYPEKRIDFNTYQTLLRNKKL